METVEFFAVWLRAKALGNRALRSEANRQLQRLGVVVRDREILSPRRRLPAGTINAFGQLIEAIDRNDTTRRRFALQALSRAGLEIQVHPQRRARSLAELIRRGAGIRIDSAEP
jgi:hypothetical protein